MHVNSATSANAIRLFDAQLASLLRGFHKGTLNVKVKEKNIGCNFLKLANLFNWNSLHVFKKSKITMVFSTLGNSINVYLRNRKHVLRVSIEL